MEQSLGHRPDRGDQGQRQDRHRDRRVAGRDRRADPAPQGRSRTRPLQGADFRQPLRQTTAARSPTSAHRRHGDARGRKSASWRRAQPHEVLETRPVRPATAGLRDAAVAGPGRLPGLQHQGRQAVHIGDTVTIPVRSCEAAPAGLQAAAADGLLRPLSRAKGRTSKNFATRWKSWRSTIPRSNTPRRAARRSASASAAASLGFCTWRSSSSGSRRSSDIDLVQTAPNVTYRIKKTTARRSTSPTRRIVPDTGQIEEFRPADRADQLPRAGRADRPDHAAVHRPPRRLSQDRISLADAGDAHLRVCRSAR